MRSFFNFGKKTWGGRWGLFLHEFNLIEFWQRIKCSTDSKKQNGVFFFFSPSLLLLRQLSWWNNSEFTKKVRPGEEKRNVGRSNEKSCCFWLLTWRTHACPGSLFSASAWVFWLGLDGVGHFHHFDRFQTFKHTRLLAELMIELVTQRKWGGQLLSTPSPTCPASKKNGQKSIQSTHLSSTFE